MPTKPPKKSEIRIDGNVSNSNIIIGEGNAVSSSTAGGNSPANSPAAAQSSGRETMPLLRLTQTSVGENKHRVEIRFENEPPIPTEFTFDISNMDYGNIRWYLEEFLQYPMEPNPEIARNIEKRMREIGTKLYESIFNSRDAIKLWGRLQSIGLNKVRVEVLTSVQDAVAIPWELMCDPDTNRPLALEAQAFVRAPVNPARLPQVIESQPDKVRILLAICRPNEERDVPFRSVASRIIKGLDEKAKNLFELDILRPPTFEQLTKTLDAANKAGKPYHIVHFDGHGTYLNVSDLFENWRNAEGSMGDFFEKWLNVDATKFSPRVIYPNEIQDGMRGYLVFENPDSEYNMRLVDGTEFGAALRNHNVPVLVLNACRSAHADFQEQPKNEEANTIHSQVRAFGSLAQEVMDAGVAGVVAMRYNVYVVTAAQFVADLYAALASGQGLGEAVSLGRKQLAAQPLREIAFDPIPLQDWSVPVVYEAAPIQLFARGDAAAPLKIDLSKKVGAEDSLPRPDVGFFGRDETILALDRAFDAHSVVLLHAYAGSGKTMTAAEFARWYKQTGGLRGPVLFTSFEQYKPLAQVLSAVEETYRPVLEANNIQWLALSEDERLNVTLQIFQHIPPLWIWDNVEPIHGFPSGADSAWSATEQRELRTFLQIVTGQSQAKFLLTSRRDERDWLGDLPQRVTLPPMPMQERVQLTRALAERHGRRISAVQDWLPLLRFTQGNPLTITVIVGQALRDGIAAPEQIQAYLEQLRAGAAAFEDEAGEGRSKSLGASLRYGFEQVFSPAERKVLALLHFFQGFVDARVIMAMGHPEMEWALPELQHLAPDTLTRLLDKAADIGLLSAHGGGYYTIHPALPWFFRALFEQYYPLTPAPSPKGRGESERSEDGVRATRAFVESMGELGEYYLQQYENGNRDVIALLRREEANLLQARALARRHGWWRALISAMQGLRVLYDHTGRRAEWKRLVEEIVPDFIGADDLPLAGREAQWSLVTQHRVLLAEESHEWGEAERLQRVCVDWDRRSASALLARPAEALSAEEKNRLRTLSVSISQLADILREQNKAECVDSYQEDYDISLRIDDKPGAAVAAFNLGHAYKDLPALRNLDEAERWYRRSLELRAEGDRKGRAQSVGQLGCIARERFQDAKKALTPSPLPLGEGERVREELLQHLNAAAKYYQQALALLPPDAVDDLAVTHHQLGNIYDDAGDLERALYHYNQDIHYDELAGNQYGAGQTRFNIALMLAQNNRLSDALLYARAALRNFESYQGRAKADEDDAKELIAAIEKAMKGG